MKTPSAVNTIDDYIAGFPGAVQNILLEIRSIVRAAAPDAVEAIKYQIPTFVLDQTNLVHFAAYERHIGFYPTPSSIKAFKVKLSSYHSAKGSVQFPLDKPMPFSLIREITVFRVKETREKKAKKGR